MRLLFVTAALLLPLASQTATAATEIHCPPSLLVQSQPDAPTGWSPYPGKDSHVLSGVTLTEGDRATQMAAAAPATLAPDREVRRGRSLIQVWEFSGPRRENVFLLCRYRNTQATLAVDLPRSVRRCTVTLELDARGERVEEPKAPLQTDCR
ncbi:STY0301 family protein [Azospirillum sp.]|uniref:STY0301 family protein n=1 Tax=Azospirillum sp. TaxID=34012 RepID=UPI0026083409|nr:STY0301 family protein [Azospirillum sp.]